MFMNVRIYHFIVGWWERKSIAIAMIELQCALETGEGPLDKIETLVITVKAISNMRAWSQGTDF